MNFVNVNLAHMLSPVCPADL